MREIDRKRGYRGVLESFLSWRNLNPAIGNVITVTLAAPLAFTKTFTRE